MCRINGLLLGILPKDYLFLYYGCSTLEFMEGPERGLTCVGIYWTRITRVP